jgi:transcriptional regulator with XRE-family HTH domain
LTVGGAIFAIRNRMDRTMVEFARIIGTDHSTVSKYESGKVPPSSSMLILLLLLARGDERAPLLKALGIGDDAELQAVYQGAVDSLLEYDRLAARAHSKSEKEEGLRKFVKEASAIVASEIPLDPAVAEVLGLIQVPEAGQKIQAHLRTLLACLDIAKPKRNRAARSEFRKKRS